MHQTPNDHALVSRPLWQISDEIGPGADVSVSRPPGRTTPLGDGVTDADVCVVGAGIAGLTTAYLCAEAGLTVVLIEGGTVGSGETLRTSAHLASALDDRFTALENHHGREGARLLYESHAFAIDHIERFCAMHAPAARFRRVPGYLYASVVERRDELGLEREAAGRAGLTAALVQAPSFGFGAVETALRFEQQAEFDPDAYLRELARAFLALGGKLWENTVVVGAEDGEPARVRLAEGGVVLARDVVVATNVPITESLSFPLKQAAYRSYVLGFEVAPDLFEPGLHWDTADPYHYVRLVAPRGESRAATLLVGGEDHRTGREHDPAARLERLSDWARGKFAGLGSPKIGWSGQIWEPFDGAGLVGKNPGSGHVHVITGDSGNGLTLGTLGAKIVLDTIRNEPNPWREIYSPDRSIARSLPRFLEENVSSIAAYLDHVKGSEVESLERLEPGRGGLLRDGARLLAVCKDPDGTCHVHSAVCPHLGAVVHWNALERSWDCPGHGSRFAANGDVICGPATEPLSRAPRGGV